MSTAPLEQRFATPVQGPAYGLLTRGLTVAIAVGTVGYGVSVGSARAALTGPLAFMLLSAGLVMVVASWFIVMGKTRIDAQGVHQDWIMAKSYGWAAIRSAKLVRLPLSTRLVLNTGRPPFKVLHAGSPELEAAFREIVAFYQARTAGQNR